MQFSLKIPRERILAIQRDMEYSGKDYDGAIYHYTSPSGLIGIMNGDGPACLRFTSADYLNDKEEGKYILRVLSKATEEYRANGASADVLHLLEAITKVGEETLYVPHATTGSMTEVVLRLGRTYICSFSKDGDSLPMWNYYVKGNSYRGYNLGFDASELLSEIQYDVDHNYKLERHVSLKVQEVIYDEKTQLDMIAREISMLDKYSGDKEELDFAALLFMQSLARMKYIFKNPCFAHESEVRAFVNWPDSAEEYLHFREGNGGVLVPYLEFLFGERLRSVTLSPLVNDELAEYSVKIMLRNNGFESVDIFKSTCPVRY